MAANDLDSAAAAPLAEAPAPTLVLDTNVALDWLLFQDARVAHIATAVTSGTARWVVCARMREEFVRVLAYPQLAPWSPDCERLLSRFDVHSELHAAPQALPLLRCTDPDDQVFLDLAVAADARWLVTHDRALLRLARRAAARGLAITTPAYWRPLS